jgi:hypothetical protein
MERHHKSNAQGSLGAVNRSIYERFSKLIWIICSLSTPFASSSSLSKRRIEDFPHLRMPVSTLIYGFPIYGLMLSI